MFFAVLLIIAIAVTYFDTESLEKVNDASKPSTDLFKMNTYTTEEGQLTHRTPC